MSLFENFLDSSIGKKVDSFVGKSIDKIDVEKVNSACDLVINGLPWIVGIGFSFCGFYGIESYLGIDFAKGVRDNLVKANLISDSHKAWYTLLGDKIIEKEEYEKIKNKNMGKISKENSLLANWKSVYDK